MKSKKISEIVAIALTFVECIVVCMDHIYLHVSSCGSNNTSNLRT